MRFKNLKKKYLFKENLDKFLEGINKSILKIDQKEKILLPELAGTRDSLIASYKRNQK